MIETASKKKTGPKPRYGEAKTMVSFRLSPEALIIIKGIAQERNVSQAEVLEQWARQYKLGGNIEETTGSFATSLDRDLVAAER